MPKIPGFIQRALQPIAAAFWAVRRCMDPLVRILSPITLLLAGLCWMEFDRYMEWRITHDRTYRCEFQADSWSLWGGWKKFPVECGVGSLSELSVQEGAETSPTSRVEDFAEAEPLLFQFPSVPVPLPPPEAR